MTAADFYHQGNDARRRGHYSEALTLYNKALELDADSPARVAREMLQQQFEFYCKDYYNP